MVFADSWVKSIFPLLATSSACVLLSTFSSAGYTSGVVLGAFVALLLASSV